MVTCYEYRCATTALKGYCTVYVKHAFLYLEIRSLHKRVKIYTYGYIYMNIRLSKTYCYYYFIILIIIIIITVAITVCICMHGVFDPYSLFSHIDIAYYVHDRSMGQHSLEFHDDISA